MKEIKSLTKNHLIVVVMKKTLIMNMIQKVGFLKLMEQFINMMKIIT